MKSEKNVNVMVMSLRNLMEIIRKFKKLLRELERKKDKFKSLKKLLRKIEKNK